MKNKLLLSGVIFALSIVPVVSGAVEGSVNASAKVKVGTTTDARLKAKAELEIRKKEFEERKEELKDEMEQKREAIKTELGERKETIKNKIEDRKEAALVNVQERLNKFIKNVQDRFDAAIERLEKLAERIDSRIAKMEAENINVVKAKELSAVAKIKIETAKTSVAGIGLESETIASSTATTTAAFKVDFQNLKTQVEQAKKDIKAAHAALVDVISNLKPGYNKARGSTTATTTAATSTATTTPNND